MKKTLTVGKRLAIGFSLLTLILVVLGAISIFISSRVGTGIKIVISQYLPLTEYTLLIRAQYPRVDAGKNALLSVYMSNESRAQQYKRFEQAEEELKKSFEKIEKLELSEEIEKLWKEFKIAHEKWWKDHEKYVELVKIFESYDIRNPTELQRDIRKFMGDHYRICDSIRHYILTGQPFEGGDDHTICDFGKWMVSFKTKNTEINTIIERIKTSHQKFHEGVKEIKMSLEKGDKDTAMQLLNNVFEDMEKTFVGFDELLSIATKAQEAYNAMSDFALITIAESYTAGRDAIQKLADTVRKEKEVISLSMDKLLNVSRLIIIFGLIIGIIIAVVISLILTRSLVKVLALISSQIREGAMQVNSASEQVAQASQSLASSASEQASSNEETSASLEELNSMIQQNAANSAQAEQMMKEAREIVTNSVSSMNTLMEEMAQLRQASANTAGIIKTIDEIAFQTNLLALNAAVEAARAGEAGKGFAVVAEEVRRLAQRSAEAAKNTQQMLEEAIRQSEKSANESQRVSEQLERVKESAEKMFTLIQEVSSASNEQAKGVEQINTAMMEINKSTQEVAANSEETASASEEMSAQANELLSMVQQLDTLIGSVSDTQTTIRSSGVSITKHQAKPQAGKGIQDRRKAKKDIHALPGAHYTDTSQVVNPEQVIPLDEEDLKSF